jgi:ATP-dependent phosphoenolpyruvate carboxykinase
MKKKSESSFHHSFIDIIEQHNNVLVNLERKELIQHVIENREAIISKNGALATWTPPESTGRSPKDTYIVQISIGIHPIIFQSAKKYLIWCFQMLWNFCSIKKEFIVPTG